MTRINGQRATDDHPIDDQLEREAVLDARVLAELERFARTGRVLTVPLEPHVLLVVVGMVELALRHPGVRDERNFSAGIARQFVDGVLDVVGHFDPDAKWAIRQANLGDWTSEDWQASDTVGLGPAAKEGLPTNDTNHTNGQC